MLAQTNYAKKKDQKRPHSIYKLAACIGLMMFHFLLKDVYSRAGPCLECLDGKSPNSLHLQTCFVATGHQP